jgi:hypothetical protein
VQYHASLVRLLSLLAVAAAACTGATPPSTESRPPPSRATALEGTAACAGAELLLPFYEGLRMPLPAREVELVYPGPLSLPFAAWRCGEEWSVVRASRLDALPVVLTLSHGRIRLRCLASCALEELTVRGDWTAVADSLRRGWTQPLVQTPLAARFDDIRFYVHRWVDASGETIDWQVDELVERMRSSPARSLVLVYGLDPANVDLRGEYLWSAEASEAARRIVSGNRGVSHLGWLNLRSYKHGIPAMGIDEEPSAAVMRDASAWDGDAHRLDAYGYRAVEMCPAAAPWQASRFRELERLIATGYRVIQLDELPIATRWHAAACRATGHLHAPGDLAGEWRQTLALVRRLAEAAHRHGVLLTSEEPSAALLPYVAGYVDRQFNAEPDVYGFWGGDAVRVPLFSTIFAGVVTPYTDIDPVTTPPPGWLVMRKERR